MSWSIKFGAEFLQNSRIWIFRFDRSRKAVLLIAGDKAGVSENKFYRDLIKRADKRFDRYLMKGDEDVQDS